MKSHPSLALLIYCINSANAAPWPSGADLPGNFAIDSPCPLIQGANLLGCLLKSDCLGNGSGGAYTESNVCGELQKCCYNYIPCANSNSIGNFCLNNGETACIGGTWEPGCPVGANGNLQCCKIPKASSFHSANEQPNLEYFQSTYVPELLFPPPLGSVLEQQQPSEQAGSANALNDLNRYFEGAQVPAGESGSNLNSPAQPVTVNSLIGYNGAPAAAPDPWTEAWGYGFD